MVARHSSEPGAVAWSAPTRAVSLEPGVLHLWRHELDGRPDALACLNEAERERARRFAFDRDRNRFVAARWFMRTVLARYVGGEPEEIELATGPNGKPELAIPRGPEFNLSHAGPVAYLAVGDVGPVGVDVELDHEVQNLADVAATVFSPQEMAAIASAGPAASTAFLRCWTRKEAVVKAIGIGIATELRDLHVGADGEEAAVAGPEGWTLIVRTLACVPGEHVAVACTRPPTAVRYYVLP